MYVTNEVNTDHQKNRELFYQKKRSMQGMGKCSELLLLNPKVIVAFEGHALERFLPQEHVSISAVQVFIHSRYSCFCNVSTFTNVYNSIL